MAFLQTACSVDGQAGCGSIYGWNFRKVWKVLWLKLQEIHGGYSSSLKAVMKIKKRWSSMVELRRKQKEEGLFLTMTPKDKLRQIGRRLGRQN